MGSAALLPGFSDFAGSRLDRVDQTRKFALHRFHICFDAECLERLHGSVAAFHGDCQQQVLRADFLLARCPGFVPGAFQNFFWRSAPEESPVAA